MEAEYTGNARALMRSRAILQSASTELARLTTAADHQFNSQFVALTRERFQLVPTVPWHMFGTCRTLPRAEVAEELLPLCKRQRLPNILKERKQRVDHAPPIPPAGIGLLTHEAHELAETSMEG